MDEKEKDTRCLECSHEFPCETIVMTDNGNWGCPKCNSNNIERITKAFEYNKVRVTYEEGPHD